MAALEEAIQELYRVPLPEFIAERKRLAGELKRAGDAAAAKALLARKRPTISVWVVNQLYWHARDAFDAMMQTAEQLRAGDLGASGEHREAIAKLRKRATAMLEDAGHTPNETTLRRVTTTLAALAATGGFEPDLPGALAEDRNPPGFEAVGIPSEPIERPAKPTRARKPGGDGHAKDEISAARAKLAAAQHAREQAEAQGRAEHLAEKRRAEAERMRIAAERHRLEAALRNAKAERVEHEREVKHLEKQLATKHHKIEKAQEQIDALERRLAGLEDHN